MEILCAPEGLYKLYFLLNAPPLAQQSSQKLPENNDPGGGGFVKFYAKAGGLG